MPDRSSILEYVSYRLYTLSRKDSLKVINTRMRCRCCRATSARRTSVRTRRTLLELAALRGSMRASMQRLCRLERGPVSKSTTAASAQVLRVAAALQEAASAAAGRRCLQDV